MRYVFLFTISLLIGVSLAYSDAGTPVRGAALYARYCASCHRDLEHTDKPNRSSGRIASAIRVLPSMYSLKVLSRSELDEIAEAIAYPRP